MPRKQNKTDSEAGNASPPAEAAPAKKTTARAKAAGKTADAPKKATRKASEAPEQAKAEAPKKAARKPADAPKAARSKAAATPRPTRAKASDASEAPAAGGARAWTREDKRVHNLVALAIGRRQILEAEPSAPGLLVADPNERNRLSDQMLQDSRDASFYLEECALHVLAGRLTLAGQAARIWQGIRVRMADTRELLTAVAPPPEPSTVSNYWLELDGRTFTFRVDWASAPSSEAELHLYRWTQIEAARAASSDTPVWKPTKDGMSLTPYLKRAYPLLPEALAGLAASLVPHAPRARGEAAFEAELESVLANATRRQLP